jgi:NtrC-family two-component system sensor histidine kinase KinB
MFPMLGVRQKISLGLGALLIIIIALGTQSVLYLSKLGVSIDVILRENYRSVIACQQMKEAAERMNDGVLFIILGRVREGDELIRENQAAFEKALQVELNNITLPTEGEKANRLRALFEQYKGLLKEAIDSTLLEGLRNHTYFTRILPLFGQIKNQADEILQLNQRNMSDANDRARQSAANARRQMYILLLAGTALAFVLVIFTRQWILGPVRRLIRSADEIRRGNLDLVVPSHSRDEIGHLSEAFNSMAASLREFKRTDQANLIRIQKATQHAFDRIPDAVAVIDTEARVDVATESARTVFGLEPGVLIKSQPFPWMMDLTRKAFQTGRTAYLEGERLIPQLVRGLERYFRPEASPILDSEGRTMGAILFLKDVTQVRHQEDIQRNVVSNISQRLEPPLTSARLAIQLLLEERAGPINKKQEELLISASEDSDRLHGIIKSLLDLSHLESGTSKIELESLSPQQIIAEAVESFRPTAERLSVHLKAEPIGDVPGVWADKKLIRQVLKNLLSNALKYTSPGGQIRLSAETDESLVRFQVADTGEGIPAALLSRIFEPFFQVPGRQNETGVGLGLAIAKKIIETHGGTVSVESHEGKGASFSFALRRADRSQK